MASNRIEIEIAALTKDTAKIRKDLQNIKGDTDKLAESQERQSKASDKATQSLASIAKAEQGAEALRTMNETVNQLAGSFGVTLPKSLQVFNRSMAEGIAAVGKLNALGIDMNTNLKTAFGSVAGAANSFNAALQVGIVAYEGTTGAVNFLTAAHKELAQIIAGTDFEKHVNSLLKLIGITEEFGDLDVKKTLFDTLFGIPGGLKPSDVIQQTTDALYGLTAASATQSAEQKVLNAAMEKHHEELEGITDETERLEKAKELLREERHEEIAQTKEATTATSEAADAIAEERREAEQAIPTKERLADAEGSMAEGERGPGYDPTETFPEEFLAPGRAITEEIMAQRAIQKVMGGTGGGMGGGLGGGSPIEVQAAERAFSGRGIGSKARGRMSHEFLRLHGLGRSGITASQMGSQVVQGNTGPDIGTIGAPRHRAPSGVTAQESGVSFGSGQGGLGRESQVGQIAAQTAGLGVTNSNAIYSGMEGIGRARGMLPPGGAAIDRSALNALMELLSSDSI